MSTDQVATCTLWESPEVPHKKCGRPAAWRWIPVTQVAFDEEEKIGPLRLCASHHALIREWNPPEDAKNWRFEQIAGADTTVDPRIGCACATWGLNWTHTPTACRPPRPVFATHAKNPTPLLRTPSK